MPNPTVPNLDHNRPLLTDDARATLVRARSERHVDGESHGNFRHLDEHGRSRPYSLTGTGTIQGTSAVKTSTMLSKARGAHC